MDENLHQWMVGGTSDEGSRNMFRRTIARALVVLCTTGLTVSSANACTLGSFGSSDQPGPGQSNPIPRQCDYGISNAHYHNLAKNTDAKFAQTRATRSRFGVRWVEIQKAPNAPYDFSSLSRQVDRAINVNHAKPLVEISEIPSWGTPEQFGKLFAAMVKQFPQVDAFEVVNEPNRTKPAPDAAFWKKPDPAVYTQFLKAAYTEAHKVRPSVTIVSGGFGPKDPKPESIDDIPWMQGLIKNRAFDYADVIGLHPYSNNGSLPSTRGSGWDHIKSTFEPALSAAGYGKKHFWITEFGASTDSKVDDQTQANVYRDSIRLVKENPKIDTVYYHTLSDYGPGTTSNHQAHFGIFHVDGSPKPALNELLNCRR